MTESHRPAGLPIPEVRPWPGFNGTAEEHILARDEVFAKYPPPLGAPDAGVDLASLLQNLGGIGAEDQPWLIGPSIQPGDCVYLVGEGGAGKSTLVADLITGVLDPDRSTVLAGAWRINRALLPERPRALIINAETSLAHAWRVHLMRANAAIGHLPNSEADLEIRDRADFIDKDDLAVTAHNLGHFMRDLASAIAGEGYSLVVIDPVYALFAPDDPGNDTWVTVGMRSFVATLKAAGVTTLAIAHPPETNSRIPKIRFKPYGSSQQKGQMDCHFGLRRAGDRAVHLVKIKDRRAGWIPPGRAAINLKFHPVQGGYSSFTYKDSDWQYENPNEFILSDGAAEYLRRLPRETFRAAAVEAAGLRRATFLGFVESYYEPQGLITSETLAERGAPKLYTWTKRGLRAIEQAASV